MIKFDMSYIMFMFTYRFRSFFRSSSLCFSREKIKCNNVLVNVTIILIKLIFSLRVYFFTI